MMKNYLRYLLPCLLILCLLSCTKDKYDTRVFGRWKISEYYLDNHPSYDTIAKYLEGYEYDFLKTTHPSFPEVNGFIKTTYQGEFAYGEYKAFSSYGIRMYFVALTTPLPVFHYPW